MQAFYADHFVAAAAAGPPLPDGQVRAAARPRCRAECPGIALAEALPASDGELALVHTPRYVSAVAEGHLSAAEQREIGFPWSPRMAERARRSVGATIAAARAALIDGQGVAANLAGGTHHAQADKGSGYCVFNDVAVAARLMQAEWHRRQRRLLRVAVIDLDVHQGNGTAAIFRDDATVFTLSLHGAKNFPFRKEPSDLDVELPDGCTDAPYLDALDAALADAVASPRRAAARPGVLPGRRRPARGRPPGPPEAQRRGPGRTRPPRLRRLSRARRAGGASAWPAATAATSTTPSRSSSAHCAGAGAMAALAAAAARCPCTSLTPCRPH